MIAVSTEDVKVLLDFKYANFYTKIYKRIIIVLYLILVFLDSTSCFDILRPISFLFIIYKYVLYLYIRSTVVIERREWPEDARLGQTSSQIYKY